MRSLHIIVHYYMKCKSVVIHTVITLKVLFVLIKFLLVGFFKQLFIFVNLYNFYNLLRKLNMLQRF
jgi:uncharacterized membrane protein